MVLLAGLSFSAVYADAQMERTYQLQLCNAQQAATLLDYTRSYDATVEQYDLVFQYIDWAGTFEQDREALASATNKKELSTKIKESNKHIRDANALYTKIASTYGRTGKENRARAVSEKRIAAEEYKNCRLCAMKPDSPACCRIIEGSETATLEIKEARILEDGSLSYLGEYTVILYEGETFTSPDGVQHTLQGIRQNLNSAAGECSVSDSEALVMSYYPEGDGGWGGPIQEGMSFVSDDYWSNWHIEIVISDISEDLSK